MSEPKKSASSPVSAGAFVYAPPGLTQLSSNVKMPRFRLIAAGAMLLLAILFGGYSYIERQSTLETGHQAARQIAEHTALITDGSLDMTRQILYTMKVLMQTSRAPRDTTQIRSTLLQMKAVNPFVMDLLVIDAKGSIAHWTGTGPQPRITDREYFTSHAQQAASPAYLGPPQMSKVHEGLWFFAMSEAMRNAQGDLEFVVATLIDVTLLRNHLDVRMAIPGSSQALMTLDGHVYAHIPGHHEHVGKLVARSEEFSKLTQYNPTLALTITSQFDGKQRIASFQRLTHYPMIVAGTVPIDELLLRWKKRMLALAVLWVALGSAILYMAQRACDLYREQIELATIDSLTGIFNRRSILDTATRLERSQEHTGTLSILMIDVDHFKSINDTFGHSIGDEVLQRISKILRTQIRTTDFVGRYGGEEFLVLMPDTGSDGALKVAEKLRASVESSVTRPRVITISIGIATTRDSDSTLDHTLTRADQALYEAKQTGRNRVKLAT